MRIRSAFLLQVTSALLPAVLMLLTVPLIRRQVDLETFAAFTVVLSTVGLLVVLDGGLGRASTYFVKLALGRGPASRVIDAFQGVVIIGVLFALAIVPAAGLLLVSLSGHAVSTARPALLILAGFIPVFVVASLLRGVLEARQQFGRSTALQLAQGAVIGVAPLVLFPLSHDLRWIAWTIGLARVVQLLILLGLCSLDLRRLFTFNVRTRLNASRVFAYSKWLFVSNLVGLTILFADRFFVAGVFSSAIIAAYVLPMEVIARIQILVAAFCTIMFPRLVGRSETVGKEGLSLLADAQGLVLCAAVIAASVLVVLAEPMMAWWLGDALAAGAAPVLVIGVLGAGLMASAALSMLFLNSRGLTRPVALLHIAEMIVYLALLAAAAKMGAVELLLVAWLVRLCADAVRMSLLCRYGSTPPLTLIGSDLWRSSRWPVAMSSLGLLAVVGLFFSALPALARVTAAMAGLSLAAYAGRIFAGRVRTSTLFASRFA